MFDKNPSRPMRLDGTPRLAGVRLRPCNTLVSPQYVSILYPCSLLHYFASISTEGQLIRVNPWQEYLINSAVVFYLQNLFIYDPYKALSSSSGEV